MDSHPAADESVVPEREAETSEKKPPDRPSPYRHKSSPTIPTKPRPPLPAKPRPPLPKKPLIAHVKPIANHTKGATDQKRTSLTRLDSTGKGKAPPPPPPPTPPVAQSPAPSLPPKDRLSPSSTLESPVVSPKTPPSPSKTATPAKNDIQTRILNSALPRKDDDASPCEPISKEPVKAEAVLPTLPPKAAASPSKSVSDAPVVSEKYMKNRSNISLHENLGLQRPLPQQPGSESEKNRPEGPPQTAPGSRPPQPPPPPKPKPKPRERPVPKRRVSVRNSTAQSLPPPPPPPPPPVPPAPKSPPVTVGSSIDTNNNNADSDPSNADFSSDEDPWLDFIHDSVSLRSLENAVLSITGWHETNSNYNDDDNSNSSSSNNNNNNNNINDNNNLSNHVNSPSSSEVSPRRPPVPVRDYNLRSPSADRSPSCLSEKSSPLSSATTTIRTRSRSEVRSNLDNRDPVQLPRKSRPTLSGAFLSDILHQDQDTSKLPVRPPRPKHEEIKRTRNKLTASDIQFMHVDFTSSQQAHELGAPILIPPKTEPKKVCPPKPQRKSLVRRSRSDATDVRDPANHKLEGETRSQKASLSSLSSPPPSPVSDRSDTSSKPLVPPPPKRWYPSQSGNNSDELSSLDGLVGQTNDPAYHEIMEQRRLNSSALSTDPSPTASPEIPKTFGQAPPLPSRNYAKDEADAHKATEVQNPPLPDRNYRDNSDSVFSSLSPEQKQYVEMTGVNNDKKSNSLPNSTETDQDSSSSSHTRPLSSVSQSSLPSDSGSGSVGTGNTNSVLISGSESSEDEAESENEKSKRNAKKVFFIAQEIVSSERVFVKILRLLNVEFRKAVSDATEKAGRPVIPTDMLNRILDYLPQLQNFNEVLLQDLEERLKEWDKVQMIADIFVKTGPFLKLYASYISNFENTQTLFDECCKKYPAFANVVKEFQASPVCGNLAIKHHMLKPIQRNPQYRLLLTDYLGYLQPDSPDYKNAQTALNIVSEVSNHANESIKNEDYIQKLMDIQYSLIGEFEVIKPGRKLVKMGELQKLSRKEMQPRVCILFNDTLLYTTPVAGGYKLINVLKLAGMKVETPTLDDFKNEFSIISTQRSFTVCANSSQERDEWIEAFTNAIEENNLKRHSFEVNRTPVAALEKGFVLGAKAPLWVPDARVSMCMLCTCDFTVTWRRHHCRACGRVVCGDCSNNKAPLRYLDNKPDRVCDECFKNLKEEVSQQLEQSQNLKEKGEDSKFSFSPEMLLTRFCKIRKSGRSMTNINRPAWLKEVHANDQGSTMSGYLKFYKGKRWKQLWFVLKDKVLYRYKASEDTAAISSTPLLGYEVKRFTEYFEGVEKGLVFELTHTGMQPMRFQTDSATATEKWVTVMREASVP